MFRDFDTMLFQTKDLLADLKKNSLLNFILEQ